METSTLQHIKISEIAISGTNPRKHFDEKDQTDLTASVKTHGVLQPILLRKIPGKQPYELVAGERRYRAAKSAGLIAIPSIVTLSMTDEEALEIQVIENLQRKDLSPMEEAESYASLINGPFKYTPESIAAKIGKSISYIKQRLRLVKLIKEGREALYKEQITLSHALAVAVIDDPEVQKQALKLCFDRWNHRSLVPVAELKKAIAENIFMPLANASFKLADDQLVPAAGACTTCPHNSGNATELFGDIKKEGMCTKPSCFTEKSHAYIESIRKEETAKGNKVLSNKECKTEFSEYGAGRLNHSSQYLIATDTCFDHPKNLSYAKILKNKIPQYIGFDCKNNIHYLYKEKEAKAAIKKEEWYKKRHSSGSSSSSTAEYRRANRRRILESTLVDKKVIETILKKGYSQELFHRYVMDILSSGSEEADICRALGLDAIADMTTNEDAQKIEAYYAKATKPQKMLLDFAFLVIESYSFKEEFLSTNKIDKKKIKIEAKKLEALEWKEKKKAPKPVKAKGNPTAAEIEREDDDSEDDE